MALIVQRVFQNLTSKQVDLVFDIVYRKRLKVLASKTNFNLLIIYAKQWLKLFLRTSISQQQQQTKSQHQQNQFLQWYK